MIPLDLSEWLIIAIYFLILAGIVALVMSKKQENTEDYFLAERSIG